MVNSESPKLRQRLPVRGLILGLAIVLVTAACLSRKPGSAMLHGWWKGLGPVLPHDSFPADCGLCHLGSNWQNLVPDFNYDHELETGVALNGAHQQARCLRCHNDRGPVVVFSERGCAGCHEDIHVGQLGSDCSSCHAEMTWRPVGQITRHLQTRFPLVGIHATTDCRRCHPAAEVGRFSPTDTECVTCHTDDLKRTDNPNHLTIGYIDRCDRCHTPTGWHQVNFRP